MLTPDILIIASENNDHAQAVQQYIETKRQNISSFILDTSCLPCQISCNISLNNDKVQITLPYVDENESLSFEKLRSIWWLEAGIPKLDPALLQNKDHAHFAFLECGQLLEAIWYVQDCLWVNQPERQEITLNPIYQLQAAKLAGFRILDTLVTSNAEALADFWKKHQRHITYRPMIPWDSSLNQFPEEYLHQSSAISSAPTLFQKSVLFKYCLLVVIIGDSIVPVQIYYKENSAEPSFQSYNLPSEMKAKIQHLIKVVGLLYSIIEIGVDEKDNYIFVGIDPYAPFLEIEKQIKIPITERIAELLIGGKIRPTQTFWPTLGRIKQEQPKRFSQHKTTLP